jgi:hypothetical protein
MKRVILIIALGNLLAGCSWLGHKNRDAEGGYTGGNAPGVDVNPGRGTTGVSSGADAGSSVTGSDLAPR